jgi:hypothetical protein
MFFISIKSTSNFSGQPRARYQTQVLSILTVYSNTDKAFYTRHKGKIKVIAIA